VDAASGVGLGSRATRERMTKPTATPSQTSVVGEGERLSAGRRRRATSSSDDNGLSLLATARLAWELYAI